MSHHIIIQARTHNMRSYHQYYVIQKKTVTFKKTKISLHFSLFLSIDCARFVTIFIQTFFIIFNNSSRANKKQHIDDMRVFITI